MEKERLSKFVVDALQLHSKAKRNYRKGLLTLTEFNGELTRILSLLGELTGVHGDSDELTHAKQSIWFTIESYDRDIIKP